MQRKSAGYVLLSFLSFTVFTTLFMTVAHAQVSSVILNGPVVTPSPTPTPAVIAAAPEQISYSPLQKPSTEEPTPAVETVKFKLQSVPRPTETPTSAPEEETTQTKVVSTADVPAPTAVPTAVPTVAPTVVPLPTATPLPKQSVTAPADLDPLFAKYAGEFGIDAEDLKGIAKCEAGFNSQADTGLYAGMFQFDSSTWASTRNAMGLDPNPELRKNAEESIRTAAFKIKNGGRRAWPNC